MYGEDYEGDGFALTTSQVFTQAKTFYCPKISSHN